MSIIPCTNDCKHQTDGYCCLNIISTVKSVDKNCPHYIKKNPQDVTTLRNDLFDSGFKSLSDGTDSHHLN